MIKTRIIPTLLYKDFTLVKGVGFDSWRSVGTIMQAVKVYNMRDVDELAFFDITATVQGRGPDFNLVDDFADECFMPLTVGGGVNSVEHVRRLLLCGADKVAFNSALVTAPDVISEAASKFGSQCIVASIDVLGADNDSYEVAIHSGKKPMGLKPVELARRAEQLGAGEIIITSIQRDGTMEGYDVELVEAVSDAVTIPVVASGGAGEFDDMYEVLQRGRCSAVAAASIFHFTQMTPLEAKRHLGEKGIAVRV